MITLCLLAVITLLTGMLIIEGNATDRAEKRYDNILVLYNKSSALIRGLKDETKVLCETISIMSKKIELLESKPAKKRPKKRTAVRPKGS